MLVEVMYSTDADHQLPFPTDIDSKKVSNSRLLSVSKSSNDRTFSKETASGGEISLVKLCRNL